MSQASTIVNVRLVIVHITFHPNNKIITAHETKTTKENNNFLQAEKQKYLSIQEITRKRGADKEIFISGLQMGEEKQGMTQVMWWRCQSKWKNMCLCFRWFYKVLPVTGWLMGCEMLYMVFGLCCLLTAWRGNDSKPLALTLATKLVVVNLYILWLLLPDSPPHTLTAQSFSKHIKHICLSPPPPLHPITLPLSPAIPHRSMECSPKLSVAKDTNPDTCKRKVEGWRGWGRWLRKGVGGTQAK